MRTITTDRTFIDFTTGKRGIRVWMDSCAVIDLEPDGNWTERGLPHEIPVDERLIAMPLSISDCIHSLAAELTRYEEQEPGGELRSLITGQLVFGDFVSTL